MTLISAPSCSALGMWAAASEGHVDGSLPIEGFNIELENQGGQKVQIGIMMGLMLHENGKNLIKRQMYKNALEVLTMEDEAFSLCDPKVLEFINNVPILQIDIVWCYFLLRDISWLSVAEICLEKAREGLERCRGKDFSRVRLLQAGCQPELALCHFVIGEVGTLEELLEVITWAQLGIHDNPYFEFTDQVWIFGTAIPLLILHL
ncbi:hypothetical protein DITRI_Ditri16bG0098400 [Diplodiscus trichospermus]